MYRYTVVIPTFNEEKYLPSLLTSIKNQSVLPKKIIVADNNSLDNTKSIALSFGCIVVEGGSPAEGRNSGAKIVETPLIIFIDADAQLLEEHFIEKCLKEFERRQLDFSSCFAANLKGNKLNGRLSVWSSNLRRFFDQICFVIIGRTLGASGWLLIVKKSVFFDLEGFDEHLKNFEDGDFYLRAFKKKYRFGILFKQAYLSGRRYDQMSLVNLFKTQLSLFLYKLGMGELSKYEKLKGPLGGN